MEEAEKNYMQSPLVQWVETFKANDGHPLEYRDLYDGVFLNDVMHQIDPRLAYDSVNRNVEDISVRLHNWEVLVRNIRGYYKDVLQQVLIMRLPNITSICREPEKDSGFAELRKGLLLILGCAVQCERREAFIDKIMAMDIGAQTEIVENIKEVTDDYETFLAAQRPDSPTSGATYVDKMFHHLNRLIKERDECAELASDLRQERDFYLSQAEGKPRVETLQVSPDKHHLALELAECKAKLRHVRQELEDRQEQLSDVNDELQQSLNNCSQLKNENASLLQEARVTRSLRDELDILKEKAAKVDLFEKEILKYKERLNELEFFKARTEELKEDNSILEETKAMLEDQLANSRKRIETVVEMESELARYRQQVDELTKDRSSDREKIEYLTGENARLEFEKKYSMNESATLEDELSAARSRIGEMGGSLSEQLSETSHARVLRLELENQRLAARLAEMKESSLIQGAEISLELEKENQRLAKRVEKLQSSACESSEQVIQMESDLSAAREERDRLVKALDAVKDHSDRQVTELERENEQLSQALDTIRERSEKTNDVKVKDLERENRRLHEAITAKNSELNKLEFDVRQSQRSGHQLQESSAHIKELEQETQELERENGELHRKVATLQHSADKLESLEQENSDLGVENRKLQKTVSSLQAASVRRDHLEQENISLTLETQRLQKTLESLKSESDRALELEADKEELSQQMTQLSKQLEGQKTQKLRHEQMEFEIIDLGNENQRLQKSMEVTMRRLQQLEKDNGDMEGENERLVKELDSAKVAVKQLEDREKEVGRLDTEVLKLNKDKATLEKENRKLRQSGEMKDSSLEEITAKFQSMDKESKALRRSLDKMQETCGRVKELETENKDLLQELNTDRRTLATLRQDLVNEKIHCQELQNELDQLTSELEKVGVNTDRLAVAEQTKDANRYKALETMIEDTLQKSSELKEEKIRGLESRLHESKGRNQKLQEELRTARRECEELKQRLEEEGEEFDHHRRGGMVREEPVGRVANMVREKDRLVKSSPSPSTAKELFDLKDHLVELERSNAKLMADSDNLRSHVTQLTEQCSKLESQVSSSQSQHATLQGHYSSLQEHNAKLQVEYTTLQSQSSSSLAVQDSLKHQLARLESDHQALSHKHDGLLNSHHSLITDHGSLQHLHEQLTSEYESLVSEHGSLKAMHKSLKAELREAHNQLDSFLQGKDDVNKLREALDREREQLQRELRSMGNLQSDYNHLREDHKQIKAAYDKLSQDYSDVLGSHKQVKTDYNTLQLKSTEQQGQLTEAKENLSVSEMEFQKLENKMEAVYQINERLENENQTLLLQIQQLLNQNHELLTQALNSKDHFAEEEKAYLERLSELRRQKERLEEKIMEHYKNRISPKKKGFGALLARKARGIISRTPKRSKSRNNLNELTDNSSHGSTEHVNDPKRLGVETVSLDGFSIRMAKRRFWFLDRRRHSVGISQDSSTPKLAKQNKMLAKSHSELHSPALDDEPSFRGAKSTEDLNEGEAGILPGLGKPFRGEDEGETVRSTTPGIPRRTPGRSSPGSEMLTLDQFLKEANKSPRNSNEQNSAEKRRQSKDNESRGSDTSTSSRERHLQRPSYMTQNQNSSSDDPRVHSEIPDGATTSLSPTSASLPGRETSSWRLSRLSAGSGNDNSSFGSTGMLPGDVFSSTPKADPENSSVQTHHHNESGNSSFANSFSRLADMSSDTPPWMGEGEGRYLSHKRQSKDEWGRQSSSQESSPYASTSRVNHSAPVYSHESTPPSQGSVRPSKSYPFQQDPSSHLSSYPSNSNNNNNNNNNNNPHRGRDLPPVPTDPPPPIPATDRLDQLTMLTSPSEPLRPSHYANPHEHTYHNNHERPGQRHDGIGRASDLNRRKSQGAADRPQGLPSQFQPPVPRSQPAQASPRSNSGVDNSVVSGHNPRRPPANLATFQNHQGQGQMVRARPASVMGSGVHVRGVISRPRQANQQPPLRRESSGGSQLRHNGSGHGEDGPSERPKSVPPHMFNKSEEIPRGDRPMPPPRRGREDRPSDSEDGQDATNPSSSTFSGVTLIREPGRPSSRPSLNSSFSPEPQRAPPPPPQPQSQPHHHHPLSSQTPPHQQQQSNSNFHLGRNVRHEINGPSSASDPRLPSPGFPSSEAHHNGWPQGNRPGSNTNPERPGHLGISPQGWSSSERRPNSQSNPPPGMVRSQSSMGHPISASQQPPPYNRSTTPGPQPGSRRDMPPNPYTRDSRPPPSSSSSSSTSPYVRNNSLPTSSNHPASSPAEPYPSDRAQQRLPRGDSEPRDLQPEDRYEGRVAPPRPLPRSHSQGPPAIRSPPTGQPATNGPSGGYSRGPQQSIPPQIRSQAGRPNQPPPPPQSSNPSKQHPPLPSHMRSPPDHHPDRSPLPTPTTQVKGQPTTVQGRQEGGGEEGAAQPKTSNSIWYEYGCV